MNKKHAKAIGLFSVAVPLRVVTTAVHLPVGTVNAALSYVTEGCDKLTNKSKEMFEQGKETWAQANSLDENKKIEKELDREAKKNAIDVEANSGTPSDNLVGQPS